MRSFSVNSLLAGAALLTTLGMSGCFSRQMVNFQTHPQQDTMLMETYEKTDYFVWAKHEHVYWSCAEQDDSLQCTRRCGGKTDLVCPAAAIFSNNVSTNTQ